MFNIHNQTDSEEDKRILRILLVKQTMKVARHDFKLFCGCCKKEVSIGLAYKCFYCGIWFCKKCAKEHFPEN